MAMSRSVRQWLSGIDAESSAIKGISQVGVLTHC
jgi:hypothetical protein